MIELVENVPHTGDVGRDTGRGFVVRDQHGFNLVLLVRCQTLPVLIEGHAFAPVDVDRVDLKTEALAEIDPQQRELTEHRSQHFVAGRQRVSDGRFPPTRSGTRKDEDLAGIGLEDLLQIGKEWLREQRKIRRAMIFKRNLHCLADTERHVREAGYREAFESWHLQSSY